MVFVSSANQVMQVINQSKDDSMHSHQFNQGSSFASEQLLKVNIEDLDESLEHNLGLLRSQGFQTLLVFVLEVLVTLEHVVWQTQEIN